MSNFIYYEKLEDYEEQVKKAKLCDEKDKEIERLKSRLEEYQEYVKINHKEIEKLNNIINELEKFLNELKINTENDIKYARSKNDDEEIIRLNREFNMTDMILVKLQKLKGEGKE